MAQWIRFLRVQVQLKAATENTNMIIFKMRRSKRVEKYFYLVTILGLTSVLLGEHLDGATIKLVF